MYDSQQSVSDSSQKVQIYLSGRSLLDMDFFSKSDPYVKMFFKRNPQQKQICLGRTETIDNNLNPTWKKSFMLDYIFEMRQQVRFEVYDEDDGNNDDFIGGVEVTLGQLAGAKNQTSLLTLQNSKKPKAKCGTIIVRLQPCVDNNQYLRMKWKAKKLMNTDSFFDFWDKSDPYLKFLKIRTDNSFIEVGRTEVVMDNLSPSWKPLELSVGKLVGTNNANKFKIQCWDWQEAGDHKHQFIGEHFMTLAELNNVPQEIKLKNPKSKKPGAIILEKVDQIVKPTFIQYLRGGMQLNLSIAIDFTGSNGTPSSPSSLHYFDPHKPNQYQAALLAVGNILLNYDSDKKIPAFGFGAKPRFPTMQNSAVSHCFPLSGRPGDIEAFGMEHLMQLYAEALKHVELSGPTYFGPILKQAIRIAQIDAGQGSNTYQVLLIMTDGQIHDMQTTVDLLVQYCNLPLSIIIVGVGNASFQNMVRLDGDNGLYSSKGKKASRDIVQFVPFRDVALNPDMLAQELLAELPGQVVQYMGLIGKPPGKPMQVDYDQLLSQDVMDPEEALKNNVAKMFQEANFFGNYQSQNPQGQQNMQNSGNVNMNNSNPYGF